MARPEMSPNIPSAGGQDLFRAAPLIQERAHEPQVRVRFELCQQVLNLVLGNNRIMFSRSTTSAREDMIRRKARLLPPAKPKLISLARKWAMGHCFGIKSRLPSREALSTTQISGTTCVQAATASTQRMVAAAWFQFRMMTAKFMDNTYLFGLFSA